MPKKPRDIEEDIRKALKLKKVKLENPIPDPPSNPPRPMQIADFTATQAEREKIEKIIQLGDFGQIEEKAARRMGFKVMLMARDLFPDVAMDVIGTSLLIVNFVIWGFELWAETKGISAW